MDAKMRKWVGHDIEDWGGVTSDDYKSFQNDYRSYIRRMCKAHGWTLAKFMPNHYEFSCFVKENTTGKHVYISIMDVRYWHNAWHNDILIRTALNDCDYKGGSNNYTTLDNLASDISKLFLRGW